MGDTDWIRDKEVREIADALVAQGWRVQAPRGGGHGIALPPDRTKRAVPLPSTPGRGRWKQNLIAQLRRSGAEL